MQRAGEPFSVIHDSPMKEPFPISAVCVYFSLTDLWFCVHVFPLSRMRIGSPLQLSGFVFPVSSGWRSGYCFPHDLWFDVGSFSFWFVVAIIESVWPQ